MNNAQLKHNSNFSKQIWSLVFLDASIIISWIAYNNYQPKLVEKFGLTNLSFFLVLAQGLILFIMPPIAGIASDYIKKKSGSSLPVISAGVSLVAMIFMCVVFSIMQEPTPLLQFLFPIFIVFWLISMNIFHSPAISMLDLFTSPKNIASVVAIITFVNDILYSLDPVIVDIIDYLGAPFTFFLGGLLIFISGFVFKKVHIYQTNTSEDKDKTTSSSFVKVFGVGLITGIGMAFLLNYFSDWTTHLYPEHSEFWSSNWVVSLILALTAFFSLLIGEKITNKNMNKLFMIAAVIMFICIGFISFLDSETLTVIFCVVFAAALGFAAVTSLPIAFSNLTIENKVFGIGLYFSGLELMNSVFTILEQL